MASTLKIFAPLTGLVLLVGCSTTHRRPDPNFPLLKTFPKQEYRVYAAGKEFHVPSVRFEGDWIILEGGYPATKAIWFG